MELGPSPETPVERISRQIHKVGRLLGSLDPELAEQFDAQGLIEQLSDHDDEDARMAVYAHLHQLWMDHNNADLLDPDAIMAEAGIIEPEA